MPRPGPLRARLGLETQTPLVLSVGRVAAGKGLELLVAAVAELPAVQLAVVGPDDGHGTTGSLIELRRRLGVEQRVHVLGPATASDVTKSYMDADVFVLASAHENFGMVAAEAAATGVPVVVTDRCGVAEFLRDGALVTPYSVDGIRDSISRLLSQPELARRVGAAGRTQALALRWPEIVLQQEEIYLDVVRRVADRDATRNAAATNA